MYKKNENNKERKKEGKEEGKSERARESHGSTHSSSSCTQTIKRLLLFLSMPLLLHSDWHLLTCTNGDVPCVPNHKALCQRIMPLMNKVRTHEARVSHTIAPTISRHPSGGKYTLVSKGMVHQSLTHIYLHRT